MFSDADLEGAHRHSIHHRAEVLSSDTCGCFYCCHVLDPSAITEWVDQDSTGTGMTALCPRCAIDAVIGSNAGFALSATFLESMRKRWFTVSRGSQKWR